MANHDNYVIQGSTLDAIASEVKTLADTSDKMTVSQITSNIAQANADVEAQASLIEQIRIALDGKASASGSEVVAQIAALIDASGVLDSTDGTVEDKVEALIDRAKDESLWYNHFKKHGYNFSSLWGFFSSYEEATLPNIDVSTFGSMTHFCANSKVERIDFYLNSEKSTSHMNCFYVTPLLTFVKGVNTSNSTNVNGMLASSVIEVIEEPLDFSKVTSANNFTNNTVKLREVRFVPETIKISLTFGTCYLLSAESVQSIIDGLAYVTTSQNLTLSNQITVTDNQKQVIRDKGWTLIQ